LEVFMKLFSTHLTRRPISWSAILAGAVATLALLAVWVVLGAAIGLAVTGEADAVWLLGGAAAWYAAGVLLSVSAGAYIAGHWSNGALDRDGSIHGLLSWAASYALIVVLGVGGLGAGILGAAGKSTAAQAPMISAIGADEYEAAKDEYLALQNPGFQAWLKAKAKGGDGFAPPERKESEKERSLISIRQEEQPRDMSVRDEPLVIFLVNETELSWSQASEFVRTNRSEINSQIEKTKDAAQAAATMGAYTAGGIFILAAVSILLAMVCGRAGLKRAAETPVSIEHTSVSNVTVVSPEPPPAGTTPAPGPAPTV
jgi:hypothetical protein